MGSERLGKKLWDKVETPQGYSFVSDDMCSWSDEQVLAFCERNIDNARQVVRTFNAIIREGRKRSSRGTP